MAPATTSGLAVASLVLSILWIGGLGSILAVILGAIALSQIKSSAGRLTGQGLAVAGVVIGAVGVVGTVGLGLLVAVGSTVVHDVNQQIQRATTPLTLQMGQTAQVSSVDTAATGIASVTVYGLDVGATPTVTEPFSRSLVTAAPGKVFAVADIQECAGPAGYQNGPSTWPFELVFVGGTSVNSTSTDAKLPSLGNVPTLGVNACTRGFLTFEMAAGTRPTGVRYNQILGHSYTWTVPVG